MHLLLHSGPLLVTALMLVVVLGASFALVAPPRSPGFRAVLVLAGFALVALGHQQMLALLGFPTASPLPGRAELVAHHITEPDAVGSGSGSITLWLIAEGNDRPRAHQLAYDRDLHERLHAARRSTAGEGRQPGRVVIRVNSSAGGIPTVEVSRASARALPPKATRQP